MSPERRREMIIAAAMPLVAEFGAAVSTARVARAAGIGEATIFRVFADKDALLDACLATALDSSSVVVELRSISLDQPIARRLTEAAEAMRAHFDRIGAVIGALQSSGYRRPRSRRGKDRRDDQDGDDSLPARDQSRQAMREAIDDLFGPDEGRLRLPVRTLTDTFLSLLFGRNSAFPGSTESVEQLVELFVYGAVVTKGQS